MDVSQFVKTEQKNTLYLFSFSETRWRILNIDKVMLECIIYKW